MPDKPSPTRKQLMFYKVHVPEDFLRGYSVEVGEDGETQRVSHGSSLDFDFGQDAKDWHFATFMLLDAEEGLEGQRAALVGFEYRPKVSIFKKLRPLFSLAFDIVLAKINRSR